jgi:hypothetical protein
LPKATATTARGGSSTASAALVGEIDLEYKAVKVKLDNGREVTLDSGYLTEGHLDHAYAMTVHKAQGPTVDKAFVLGSEDLYRELGYTALSRHRDEARFYVAAPDLEPEVERDLPDVDPVVFGLEQLLERSGAKRLALDSLKNRDTHELHDERRELRAIFADTELPSLREVTELGCERDRARYALDQAEERIAHLEDLRDHTRLFEFRERRRLDQLIEHARDARADRIEQLEVVTTAHDLAVGRVEDWLGRYADQAARLVGADRELAERLELDRTAIERQRALERTPHRPRRELPAPELDRGIGLDRGW